MDYRILLGSTVFHTNLRLFFLSEISTPKGAVIQTLRLGMGALASPANPSSETLTSYVMHNYTPSTLRHARPPSRGDGGAPALPSTLRRGLQT